MKLIRTISLILGVVFCIALGIAATIKRAHADPSRPVFCAIPATTISAGTTSTRIPLPAPAKACPVLTITNGGTVPVYCATGDATVTAGPGGAMRTIQPGTPGIFTARVTDTYIACSTATGTAGVTVEQSDAQPNIARAPGSGGGGGGAVNSVGAVAPIESSGGYNPVISFGASPANTVLAGPPSGASGQTAARALVAADLPLATASAPGAVKPGSGLTVAADGTLSATGSTGGTVSVNGAAVTNPNFTDSTSQTNAVNFSASGAVVNASLSALTNITGSSLNLTDTTAAANTVTLDAPATLANSYAVTFPPGQCASGQVWRFNDAAGTMGCASLPAAGVAGVTGNIVGGTPANPVVNQVQPDWNAASGLGVILNKPTIPAGQVNSDWNASTGVAQILNKPTIPAGTTVQGGTTGTPLTGAVRIVPGANVTVIETGQDIVIGSTGGSVNLSSPNGTLAVVGTSPNYTLDIAQQAATNGQVLAWNGTKYAPTTPAAAGVASLAASGQPALTGAILLAAGPGVTLAQSGNIITITSTGGGGGSITAAAAWQSGGTSKDQYTAPGTVNSQGVNLTLTASAGGTVTVTGVTVGGVALTGTFTVTGAFPNFIVTVPAGQVPATVQLAGGAVQVVGTLAGTQFSSNANSLTTLAPVPFSASLAAAYTSSSLPYYTTHSNATWTYSATGTANTYSGTITADGITSPANTQTGFLASIVATGITIGGSVTGTGSRGAGSSTVPMSGSVPAVPVYVPAFYAQTANSTVPTFTAGSNQTPGAAAGSTITYPAAIAASQYNWVAVDAAVPLSKLCIQIAFGCNPLTPASTTAATIAGRGYTIYSVTSLGVGTAMQLTINP